MTTLTIKWTKIRKESHQLTASFDGDVDMIVFYNYSEKIFDEDAQCVSSKLY